MRLVVEWSQSGGYECGEYEYTACCTYDSAEAFLLAFEDKLRTFRDAETAERAAVRRLRHERYRVVEDENYEAHTRAHEALRAADRFELGGQIWSASEFEALPDVFELEEWHALRLREPRY